MHAQTVDTRPYFIASRAFQRQKRRTGDEARQTVETNGVMNVVNSRDSGSSSTCQNPEFSSSFEKYFASPICARMYSTVGSIKRSLHTFAFSLVKSTHIRTLPSDFGTTTKPAHHSVGESIFSITPRSTIRCSSAFTLGRSGIERHSSWSGECKWCGIALELDFVVVLELP